jgi:charged multivesicular body protein 7
VDGLQSQVDSLQRQIDARTAQAAEAVRQKRVKDVALLHLRVRRNLEELLSKRVGALNNLQSTLLQVETVVGDVEVRCILRCFRILLLMRTLYPRS